MHTDSLLPMLSLDRSLWAIRREALQRLPQAHRFATEPALADLARAAAAADKPQAARRGGDTRAAGAVQVITLTGVLTPRGSLFSYIFGGGGGGVQAFREEFAEAVTNPDVGAIVLDIDSPGGLIDLVPEAADEVREARGTKPIVAVANTMAASGAYYIASQADEIVVTPSGSGGSIGVYILHLDFSGWNEQAGIDPTYISAGRYKTEGNEDEPLTEEALEHFQEEVDDLYTGFVDAVAEGRGVSAQAVRSGYGEGRCLLAPRAVEAGLADRVDTLETVIGEFLGSPQGGAVARAARIEAARKAAAKRAEVPADPAAPATPPAEEPPAVDPSPEPAPVDPEPAPPVETEVDTDPADQPAPETDPADADDPVQPVELPDGEPAEESDPGERAAIAALLVG